MSKLIRRRDLFVAGAACAMSLSLPRRVAAQSSAPSMPLGVSRLTDGLTLITGAGANVTVAGSAEGALIVDGGSPQHAEAVLRSVADTTGSDTVVYLFNTNWRPEHTGLNETLGPRGTAMLAHENTKLWMGADFDVQWEGRDHDPRPAAALPNRTFYTSGTVDFGGERIDYGHLAQAHTDGDIYVLFGNANVLAVSDLLTVGSYPIVDHITGGWIGGLEQATEALLELTDDETRIIPAVGPVQHRDALEAQLILCTAVREAVTSAFRMGHSVEEFMASRPTRDFDAERGDPTLFLQLVYKGAWGHVRELGGGVI